MRSCHMNGGICPIIMTGCVLGIIGCVLVSNEVGFLMSSPLV